MTTSTSSPQRAPSRSPRPSALGRARTALLDLLFPPRCAGCGRRGTWLCAACAAQVAPLQPPLCLRCGKPLGAGVGRGGLCRTCRDGDLQALDWARAVYPFAGPVREAIHRFKYGRERARAAHLGQPLVALLDHFPASDGHRLLPVPLSAERRRERGYNQAEELARVLAAATGWPVETALARTRATRPQVGLDRGARHRNVRGAFTWQGAALDGAHLVLVDDVLTTGATADECAAVLKAAGADWVGLVTVARAVDHR